LLVTIVDVFISNLDSREMLTDRFATQFCITQSRRTPGTLTVLLFALWQWFAPFCWH
jgi:hypothetical protein